MIYGIGVDLVHTPRFEKAIERWGGRFIQRVFTPNEVKLCFDRPSPSSAFALRFAAKEAFSKALGMGMKRGLRWREIEVFNDPKGKPGLALQGNSLELCRSRGVIASHLSLSDDGEYALAMVVLERGKGSEEGSSCGRPSM